MSESLKKFSAGLLSLAIVGGVGGFLTKSLVDAQRKPAAEVTSVQTGAIETVTVVGNRRPS